MSKNNKKIILPPDFFQLLSNKHLLLDTSFFGDYSSNQEVFIDFVEQCKQHNIVFVTNVPVVIEFSRGPDTSQIFAQRTALINKIAATLLPITPAVFQHELSWLVEKYGQHGKKVSLTDFILAAQTKLHHHDLCLLTKNPQDFPTSIFSVKTYFLLQLERGLQVYGVYFYESDKN